ncbi:MAG TPA: hypothetical protein PLQ88_34205, partial [Blastocatellia bacterium]|nr:hypothetical protein [Blastocatellia bacterium]
ISATEAQQKLDQYRSITGKRRLKEDDKLESLYASISKGARVLNLTAAFKQTGLNEYGEPKLAIARADWPTVHFFPRRGLGDWSQQFESGSGGFSDRIQWNAQARTRNIALPGNTFNDRALTRNRLESPVPHIPPTLRPRFGLHNYHILFEVQEWKAYPLDPFLLRRISGMLFVVEAEWDLTPLEAELLASMRAGN